MRFPRVKIGQRFTFQGKRYTKTGPLTASEEGTGSPRMIQRSAEVTLLDVPTDSSKLPFKASYSRAELESAVASYRGLLEKRFKQAAGADGNLTLERILTLLDAVDKHGEWKS